MRRKIFFAASLGIALAGSALAGTSMGNASTPSVDLALSGSTVAGVTSGVDLGHELAFSFTLKNKSTTTAAEVGFNFTITNGTADINDYICPQIGTHAAINPDTPDCEPGTLGPGKSTQAAILATQTGRPMVVKACAFDISSYPDPVSSNNCKTLTVK